MKVPHLNRQLVLEAPQRVADGAGGFSETWVALGTHWAKVTPGSGSARSEGVASVSSVSMRIVVRGAPQEAASRPAPGQRFREGTRLFAINAVREWDAQGRYLECFADEEVAA